MVEFSMKKWTLILLHFVGMPETERNSCYTYGQSPENILYEGRLKRGQMLWQYTLQYSGLNRCRQWHNINYQQQQQQQQHKEHLLKFCHGT